MTLDSWLAAPTSIVNPTAKKAFFIPFELTEPIVIANLFVRNGNTASGNVDCGIYDVAGTRIVSIGSTVMSGTSTIQAFNITDTLIGPGSFYMAFVCDNTTGAFIAMNPSIESLRTAGVVEQILGALPLPATATFAQLADNFVPWVGLTTRSFV